MYSLVKNFFVCIFSVIILMSTRSAAQDIPEIELRLIEGVTFSNPMQVLSPNDETDRLFVVERRGTVQVLKRESNNTFTYLNNFISVYVDQNGEGGLLSMAFHPNYAVNRTFFLFYTNYFTGNLEIARYQASATNPNLYRPESEQIILTIEHPGLNHNGGEMHFGPDGMLYVSTGDAGSAGAPNQNAQDEEVFLGKILRLDVDGPSLFPSDNPIPASPVYATGLRNPVRWSFDRETNDLWLGDVGQNSFEEINYVPFSNLQGANFGWSYFEGLACFNVNNCPERADYTFPIHTYNTTPGGVRSVIGGVVYRGSDYPSMMGLYIGADHYGTHLHVIARDGENFVVDKTMSCPINIIDFGESKNGELYAVTLTGQLYRVIVKETDPLPVTFVNFTVTSGEKRSALLEWETVQFGAFKGYDVERSTDGSRFDKIATLDAITSENGAIQYSYSDHSLLNAPVLYYRIKALDQDGSFQYSTIVSYTPPRGDLVSTGATPRYIRSNPIRNGRLELLSADNLSELRIVALSGQTIQHFDLINRSGSVSVECGHITPGLYIAVLSGPEKIVVEKVIFQ